MALNRILASLCIFSCVFVTAVLTTANAAMAQGFLGKAYNDAKSTVKRESSNAGGAVSKGWQDTRKAATNTTKKAENYSKQKVGSGVNTAKGWGGQLNNSARGAANNANRGFNSAKGAINNGGKALGNFGTQGYNSAKGAVNNSARNLGNVRTGGQNAFGNPTFNGGLGNNFLPKTPNFSRQADHWRDSIQGGGRQLQREAGRAADSVQRGYDNVRNNPGVRGTQNAIRQSNPGVVVRQQADRVMRGEVAPGGSNSFLPPVPAAISNLPQNVANAPSGAVKIIQQGAEPVAQAARGIERGAREFGGQAADTGKQFAGDVARESKAAGVVVTRTTEEIFAGGGQILGEGLKQGGQAAEDLGQGAGTILTAGAEGIEQIAADGTELYQQGEKTFQDGKALYDEGKALYDEGRKNYNEAKDIYDTVRKGDRGEILEKLEEKTGVTVEGEVKKALLETDLVDAVEAVENATGIDMENAKQRVEQAQAIGDAFRSGDLNDVEQAAGAKTNRDQIKAEKAAGYDGVAWGNEIDHEEYVKMTGAVGASVVSGNAGPFMAYAKEWAAEQYKTLSESLIKEGKADLASKLNEQMLVDALQGAMNGQPAELPIKGVKIDVGLATYNHSLEVSAGVPEITRNGIEINQQGAKTSLPNTHQPYVRYKIE